MENTPPPPPPPPFFIHSSKFCCSWSLFSLITHFLLMLLHFSIPFPSPSLSPIPSPLLHSVHSIPSPSLSPFHPLSFPQFIPSLLLHSYHFSFSSPPPPPFLFPSLSRVRSAGLKLTSTGLLWARTWPQCTKWAWHSGGLPNSPESRSFSTRGSSTYTSPPCERYLVTFSNTVDDPNNPLHIMIWDVKTGEKKRSFIKGSLDY